MSQSSAPYELKIDLNALNHLGIGLYSNVPAVLSEIVANAYDADATTVSVSIIKNPNGNQDLDQIVIQDSGHGMTRQDVNKRFLTVGYQRRKEQPGKTPSGREPMGRKGIGKLSIFSIAEDILVETIKDDEKSALRMVVQDILDAMNSGLGSYLPEEQPTSTIDFVHGTRITLSKLTKRQTIRTANELRYRLARRFSIIGAEHNFQVEVNGTLITPSDRGYYPKLQFMWTYGDQTQKINLATNLQTKQPVEDRILHVTDDKLGLRITGWLGTVTQSSELKDEAGDNLNRIAIFMRGKMAQEDLLSDFTERGVYASYLIGELEIHGLDVDEQPDPATSSRQKLVEDDMRYQRIKTMIQGELKYIQGQWSELRTDEGAKKAIEIPAVNDWIQGLEKSYQLTAKQWLGRLNRLKTDTEDEKKRLIKHAILAFEFYRWNENLERLSEIGDDGVQDVLRLFEELQTLEVNLYGQIVRQRLAIVTTLLEKVDAEELEKTIQTYIFERLWLLDPAWERTNAPPYIETRIDQFLKENNAGLTDEEKRSRIDIKYRKTAGEHVIIELKRPGRKVKLYDELLPQIVKYRQGVRKVLDDANLKNEPIEIVCLISSYPTDYLQDKESAQKTLEAHNARITLYDTLLNDTYQAYKEYIDKRVHVDRLAKVIEEIDDFGSEPNSSQ